MNNLFGFDPDGPAMTPLERKRMKRRAYETPRGHVATPGTGPEGETCGSCGHAVRQQMSKSWIKCGLNKANWTGSRRTDVRAGDAACAKWEPTL